MKKVNSIAGFEASNVLEARPDLDPKRSAIIVVDMINHQVTPGTGLMKQFEDGGISTDYIVSRVAELVVPNTGRLIEQARTEGARVVFLRVGGVDPDLEDTLPAGRANLRAWGAIDGTWPCQVISQLAPRPGELSLLKLGSGGFTSSNLDQHLRFMGVESLFFTGVLTNVCVLLTAAGAFDLGYSGYLVSDATATLHDGLQTATETIISSFMARVVSTEAAIDLLGNRQSSHAISG